ncbi:hypothetical protein GCM10023144_33800 [Pigmentiphaga soli]|uniref:Uncharacterized protein n=1 Tax=Pigmentiphaga soli TaxID=1007095 RepID=A0ABP8HD27_9BURK
MVVFEKQADLLEDALLAGDFQVEQDIRRRKNPRNQVHGSGNRPAARAKKGTGPGTEKWKQQNFDYSQLKKSVTNRGAALRDLATCRADGTGLTHAGDRPACWRRRPL